MHEVWVEESIIYIIYTWSGLKCVRRFMVWVEESPWCTRSGLKCVQRIYGQG